MNGKIWARGPCIYGLSHTKLLRQILESIWEHPEKTYLWKSENQQIQKHRNRCAPNCLIFLKFQIQKSFNFEMLKLWNFEILKNRR